MKIEAFPDMKVARSDQLRKMFNLRTSQGQLWLLVVHAVSGGGCCMSGEMFLVDHPSWL